MTISTRLTRAGLACLVFGSCAALLPNNGGIVMAASTTCPNSNPSTAVSRTGTIVAVTAGSAAVIFLADPALFGVSGGGIFGSGAAAAAGAFDPSTEMFQFIYDSSSPSS